MSVKEIESKVSELRELRQMAAELAGEITALEDALKAQMANTGREELEGAGFRITWREVTSSRLDSKALKAAAPELWQRFSRTTTARRFVLT